MSNSRRKSGSLLFKQYANEKEIVCAPKSTEVFARHTREHIDVFIMVQDAQKLTTLRPTILDYMLMNWRLQR
jgi:hypothetical protein